MIVAKVSTLPDLSNCLLRLWWIVHAAVNRHGELPLVPRDLTLGAEKKVGLMELVSYVGAPET